MQQVIVWVIYKPVDVEIDDDKREKKNEMITFIHSFIPLCISNTNPYTIIKYFHEFAISLKASGQAALLSCQRDSVRHSKST